MPQGMAVGRFVYRKLEPIYGTKKPLCQHVSLPPGNYLAGLSLAQSTATATDVKTLTATGTPTGGSFTFLVQHPDSGTQQSLVVPYNATAAVLRGLAEAIYGPGNIVAGGGAWPGSALTLTGAGEYLNRFLPAITLGTNSFTGGTTPTATVTHTTVGRKAGMFEAFATGGANGLGTFRAFLQYDTHVDASGLHQYGGRDAATQPSVPALFTGVFKSQDVIGFTAAALIAVGGKQHSGSITDGIFEI